MKAYVITTGLIFGLITAAHLMRVVTEPHVATEPLFILLTVLSAALCGWAWMVLRRLRQ